MPVLIRNTYSSIVFTRISVINFIILRLNSLQIIAFLDYFEFNYQYHMHECFMPTKAHFTKCDIVSMTSTCRTFTLKQTS